MRRALSATFLCWAVAATPISVTDGDTFSARVRVWPGLVAEETVRVLGVNAPERKGATREAGDAARAFTASWLHEAEIRLHTCERDAFGRLLATVTRKHDGANLATDLMGGDYAQPYKPR
jgi:endonuclease YncB( thermonuclease family)